MVRRSRSRRGAVGGRTWFHDRLRKNRAQIQLRAAMITFRIRLCGAITPSHAPFVLRLNVTRCTSVRLRPDTIMSPWTRVNQWMQPSTGDRHRTPTHCEITPHCDIIRGLAQRCSPASCTW